ncbi:MAG: choice-of-anchor tandem repeat GloVer-containing protein [Candidatus Sulfotelmatobacter sp.]
MNVWRFCMSVMLAFLGLAVGASAQFSVLYNFGSNSGDPVGPSSSGIIAQGRDGNLYSATCNGGVHDKGAVFKITPAGTMTVLYNFDGTFGSCPGGGLTLGTDGNFYGTAGGGGRYDVGTVFKITSAGSLIVLHNFVSANEGRDPGAPPVQGTDGNFYGTTLSGGQHAVGTIYRITPSGDFTTLHSFSGSDGAVPFAPLVLGADGSFYGVTSEGGGTGCSAVGCGVVFKITPPYKFAVIYSFDGNDAGYPVGPLIQASDGNFYGTGSRGPGTVFRLTPKGKFTVVHTMNNAEGTNPAAGLVQASDGSGYGANSYWGSGSNCGADGCGTFFYLMPNGSFSVLHNFDNTTGATPNVTPFQHTNGILYGDTSAGGTYNEGVFYSWNASLPTFVSLLPYFGKVGATIEFLGQGFTGTTGVSFNGTSAKFAVVSDTYLTATVPTGATTGVVTVATPSGTSMSNKKFQIVQ